jgi:very-short-patch-repair endonuclease
MRKSDDAEYARLQTFAKNMRQQPTDAENLIWYYLRGKRTFDVKFKRQVILRPYIVDFICVSHRLIIEIDGGQHSETADATRNAWLEAQGFRVLHFWNNDVLTQTESVLETIRLNLEKS